jgi:HD-like signal output (HDOD) protein
MELFPHLSDLFKRRPLSGGAMSKSLEQKKIEQIENLPTLPEVANKLLKIINDPTTTAVDVANLISRDLSLTSKVLRLANSAFYGIPRTVTTVQNAVVILGLKVINTMVFSITVVKMFPGDGSNALFSRKKFWAHSLACAVLSRQLALRMRKFTLFDPEECFCAGLIHDIGRVVLDQYFHENFLKAVQKAMEAKIPLLQAENEVFGFNHMDVGDWLTSRWELPQDIRVPIVHHHNPGKTEYAREITTLVHLADSLCYEINFGLPGLETRPPVDAALIGQLGFTQEDLDAVKASAAEEIEKFQAAFEI